MISSASGTADKTENHDPTYHRYNLRFYGNESRSLAQESLSSDGRARKLVTCASDKS
jgi:hypothetical protein